MALETTKSLNFDLNLTGNDRHHRQYNTIGSQRQVSTAVVRRTPLEADNIQRRALVDFSVLGVVGFNIGHLPLFVRHMISYFAHDLQLLHVLLF